MQWLRQTSKSKQTERGSPSFIPGMRDNTACQGEAGTSTGVNIAPGSDDDGWIVPASRDARRRHDACSSTRTARRCTRLSRRSSSAKRRICLEVYIFADDDTGKAFAELLCQKAQEGVQVLCHLRLASARSSTDQRLVHPHEPRRRALAGVSPVLAVGGKFSWRPLNRDHRKLLVIDDDIAGLGGLNVGAEYAGSWVGPHGSQTCDFWRDNAIGIVGPSVKPLQQSFANSWNYVTHGGHLSRARLEYNLDFKNGDLAVMASSPTRRSHVTPILGRLVDGAKHSIDLTMAYFAPPDELIDGLCRAAKRGVRVRLMLPGKCDVKLLVIAARSFYEKLLTAGVEIYERQARRAARQDDGDRPRDRGDRLDEPRLPQHRIQPRALRDDPPQAIWRAGMRHVRERRAVTPNKSRSRNGGNAPCSTASVNGR